MPTSSRTLTPRWHAVSGSLGALPVPWAPQGGEGSGRGADAVPCPPPPLAETVAKTGMILLAGEITSRAAVDYQKVVRDTIRHIGYDDSSKGGCPAAGVGGAGAGSVPPWPG